MESKIEVPILKHLILLGGGHAHVEVIRMLRMKPIPGLTVSLVTTEAHTAYSGMLPGYIAGFYDFDECHIDLSRLASLCGVHFIQAAATKIDAKAKLLHLKGRTPVRFDVLSVNVGISPSGQGVPGSMEFSTPVKPVSSFVQRLQRIRERHKAAKSQLKIVIVGGGAGGVELTMAMHESLHKGHTHGVQIRLITRSKVLPSHPSAARSKVLRIAKEKGIDILEEAEVLEVKQNCICFKNGKQIDYDECLWCTQAEAPSWLKNCDLPLDDKGFVSIRETLQCEGGLDNVFACGDVASCRLHPRPKSGVFAVRQGPALSTNLRNLLEGQPLLPHIPQSTSLGLITTGDQYAIASKGWLCLEGAYLWRWKDRIDRTWMAKYGADLEPMQEVPLESSIADSPEAISTLAQAHMRCGGCGSKVGATVLSSALARLHPSSNEATIHTGLSALDDAALIRPPPEGYLLVQTVDFFRTMISDPYSFGAVAANHALSDCHAMGAQAKTALAIAVVPHSQDSIAEEILFQILSGAVSILGQAGCSLVGGHSSEGPELALGFTINGQVQEHGVMLKSKAEVGQAVILTKPLGTGVLLAAHMRGLAKGRWMAGCLQHMQQSNENAARILSSHSCKCTTDITGFGLLGHLKEVCCASKVGVKLNIAAIPFLEGSLACSKAGVSSSLLPSNSRVSAWVSDLLTASTSSEWPLLLDPQTAGGLLATVPVDEASKVVVLLQEQGYKHAAVIGEVTEKIEIGAQPQEVIELINLSEKNDV